MLKRRLLKNLLLVGNILLNGSHSFVHRRLLLLQRSRRFDNQLVRQVLRIFAQAHVRLR